jgi:endonuclease/exonuclease/phosphatase family metal-dependent hydrolase
MLVRLLTFNIHGWLTIAGKFNLESVSQVIADTGADIVALNEVFHPQRTADSQLPKDMPALTHLAERLDMHPVFGPCLRWPATDTLPDHSYGNALLSRWPIIASAAHHLTPVEGKEQRGLLEGRILLPDDTPFTVYVTHLDHTDEAARLIQLRAVRTWTVRDRNRPHVVMGDFNAIHPWDYEHRPAELDLLAVHPKGKNMVDDGKGPQVIPQMEKAGYTDAMRACGKPGQKTFLPAEDDIRIDYIWLSEALAPTVRSAQVWIEAAGEEASDHRPVLVEIELKP